MKKTLAIILALVCLTAVFSACNTDSTDNPLANGPDTTTSANGKIPVNHGDTVSYPMPVIDELKYDINFDEYITLPDYKSFELEYNTMENSEKAIDDQIFNIQLKHSVRDDITDRAAAEGDVATISYTAVFYGTDKQFADQKNVEVVLGRRIHIPGLEDAILGMNIGETKTTDIVYPPDSRYKELASTKTTFTITLNKLQSAGYPALTPENIVKFDLGADVNDEESLRRYVSALINEQNLLYKQKAIYERLMKESVLIAMPEREYKYYQDLFYANLEARAKSAGITADNLIRDEYGTQEAYELARDEDAQQKVFEDLVIYSLKEDYGVEVTQEEYDFALRAFFDSGAGESVGLKTLEEFHANMSTSVYKNELLMQVLDAVSADVKDAE